MSYNYWKSGLPIKTKTSCYSLILVRFALLIFFFLNYPILCFWTNLLFSTVICIWSIYSSSTSSLWRTILGCVGSKILQDTGLFKHQTSRMSYITLLAEREVYLCQRRKTLANQDSLRPSPPTKISHLHQQMNMSPTKTIKVMEND